MQCLLFPPRLIPVAAGLSPACERHCQRTIELAAMGSRAPRLVAACCVCERAFLRAGMTSRDPGRGAGRAGELPSQSQRAHRRASPAAHGAHGRAHGGLASWMVESAAACRCGEGIELAARTPQSS